MQEEQIGEGILLVSMQCLSICSPGSATLPFVHATQVLATVMPVGTEHYDHSSLAYPSAHSNCSESGQAYKATPHLVLREAAGWMSTPTWSPFLAM